MIAVILGLAVTAGCGKSPTPLPTDIATTPADAGTIADGDSAVAIVVPDAGPIATADSGFIPDAIELACVSAASCPKVGACHVRVCQGGVCGSAVSADGSPCLPAPCWEGQCDTGACKSPVQPLHFERVYEDLGAGMTYGVAADGVNGLTFATAHWNSATDRLVVHTDASGQVLGKQPLPVVLPGDQAITAMTRLGDGSVVVAVLRVPKAYDSDARIIRLDAAGKQLWATTLALAHSSGDAYWDEIGAIRPFPDKSLLLAGSATFPNGLHRGVLAKVDASGKLLWHKMVFDDAFNTADTIVTLGNGSALLGGSVLDNWTTASPFVATVTSEGEVGEYNAFGGKFGNMPRVTDLVRRPDGSFACIVRSDNQRWLVMFDLAKGISHVQPVEIAVYGGLAALPDGGLAYTSGNGAQEVAALHRTDPDGKKLWTTTFATPKALPTSMALLPGGDFAVSGFDSVQNKAWLARVGSDGSADCWSNGKCAGLSAKLCADTDECTTDVCDEASGCVHIAKTNCLP